MSSTGVALRHSHGSRHFVTNNTPSYGKQRPRSLNHNLAGREMRFVGHTVGNLGLAPCSTGPSPPISASRHAAYPATISPSEPYYR